MGELVRFLNPIERTKDVVAGDLAAVMAHLEPKIHDGPVIQGMKGAVLELRLLMEVLAQVKEAKDLVTYLKSSGLAAALSKKVLQECDTRWNSLHTMLSSVLDVYDKVRKLRLAPLALSTVTRTAASVRRRRPPPQVRAARPPRPTAAVMCLPLPSVPAARPWPRPRCAAVVHHHEYTPLEFVGHSQIISQNLS